MDEFMRTVLTRLGAPVTAQNLQFMYAWAQAEGGDTHNDASWNPLNTTQAFGSSRSINKVGVKAYSSFADGVEATVKTLTNGRYSPIVSGLQSGTSTATQLAQQVAKSPWGTGSGVLKVLGGGKVQTGSTSLTGGSRSAATAGATGSAAGGVGGAGGGTLPQYEAKPQASIGAYGWLRALAASDPELSKLMKEYANQDLTVPAVATRLEGEIRDTGWYKKHSEGQRQLQILKATDPAAYREKVNNAKDAMSRAAYKLGVTLSPQELTQVSYQAITGGWSQDQINSFMFKVGDVKTNGALTTTEAGLQQTAAQYLVPVSDKTLRQWSENVLTGKITPEDFTNYAREQAKSMFPGLSDAIDRGVTVETYVDPYRQAAAKALEIPPESVDFMDPKWGKALNQIDPKTGQRVSMSLTDWQKTIRTDPSYGWDRTQNARQASADLTSQLTRMFGGVA